MGVDTLGYLSKDVTAEQICNVISDKYDKDVKCNVEKGTDGVTCGSIYFKDEKDERRIFYYNAPDEDKVSLSFSHWGNSVDIMANILKCFGGQLVEDDCAELDPVDIPKDENYIHHDRSIMLDKIVNILDAKLDIFEKRKIAKEILEHKDQLKNILK